MKIYTIYCDDDSGIAICSFSTLEKAQKWAQGVIEDVGRDYFKRDCTGCDYIEHWECCFDTNNIYIYEQTIDQYDS